MAIARGNRKAQLLREALKLFSGAGYDKVTVKQLGDICGITEPAVYRHYESKEALFDAVLVSVESRLDHSALGAKVEGEKDVRRLLQKFGAGLFDVFARNKDLCRLLLYTALKKPAKSRKLYHVIRGGYEVVLAEQLTRLYKKKAIPKRNFAVTAQSFVGLVFDCAVGQMLWKKAQGRTFKPKEVLADIVPLFAKGMGK